MSTKTKTKTKRPRSEAKKTSKKSIAAESTKPRDVEEDTKGKQSVDDRDDRAAEDDDVFDPNIELYENDSEDEREERAAADEYYGEVEDIEDILASDGEEDHLYASDSSDEEAYLDVNKVGNIPMEWYDDYEHIGYDIEGNKILKAMPKDELEKFLQTNDGSGRQWMTVWDEKNGREVVLTKKQFDTLRRIQQARFPEKTTEEFETVEFPFDNTHPVSNRPVPKSRFVPSKWEAKRIAYLVKAIRKGWIKLDDDKEREEKEKAAKRWYLLWDEQKDDESEVVKKRDQVLSAPPPKMKLPGHSESYRPPAEYILNAEEQRAWEQMDKKDRPTNFLPKSFDRLLHVPLYKKNINERFERCLDLYLCPRLPSKPLRVANKEMLLPKLPKPRELRPFPITLAVQYLGHTKRIKSISVSPTGQWLVSGSDDKTIRVWHVETGRCVKQWSVGGKVKSVAWNPSLEVNVIAAAVEDLGVLLINPMNGSEELSEATDVVLSNKGSSGDDVVTWQKVVSPELYNAGIRLQVLGPKDFENVSWHSKGDYFATVAPEAGSNAVMIHRLSQHQSQTPFKKSKGTVVSVKFHPTKPLFFVATTRYVRIYNLLKQSLFKKLLPGVNEISSFDIHPGGDNVILGSYDTRVSWFDLDLSVKPYRTLRYHKESVNHVAYHKRYPLFASASDDGMVHIFHGMVYNDLLENALIVPVNILKGHKVTKGDGVIDCAFHPSQPWIFTAGGDATINLYSS